MANRRDLLFLVAILTAIHGALLGYDYLHPEAFLMGDRSGTRMTLVKNFATAVLDNKEIIQTLSTQGIIGDYFIHALAYMAGGRIGILVLQIAASVFSVCAVFLLALSLTESRKVAWISAIVYATLPHSLAFPHLLVTETFANSFLIFSVYALIKSANERDASPRHLEVAGIWIALSMLVRPIVIFLPLFVGLALAVSGAYSRKVIATHYLSAAYIPLLAWMGFMAITTDHFTTGSSGSTLGYNLYLRVERMHMGAPDEMPAPALLDRSQKKISPTEYVGYIIDDPGQYINLLKFDIANLLLNSGVNKLLGYYLGVYDPGSERGRHWRTIVDQRGFIQGLLGVLQGSSIFILSTIVFTLYWIVLLIGAVLGFRHYLVSDLTGKAEKLILILVPVYILATTLIIVSGPRSGHRSSFEFILCLMFAIYISRHGFPPSLQSNKATISRLKQSWTPTVPPVSG